MFPNGGYCGLLHNSDVFSGDCSQVITCNLLYAIKHNIYFSLTFTSLKIFIGKMFVIFTVFGKRSQSVIPHSLELPKIL